MCARGNAAGVGCGLTLCAHVAWGGVGGAGQVARLEHDAAAATASAAEQAQAVRRLERACTLLERENEFLRAQLDSADLVAPSLSGGAVPLPQQLDQLVASYKDTIVALEAELVRARAAHSTAAPPLPSSSSAAPMDTDPSASGKLVEAAVVEQLRHEHELTLRQVEALQQQLGVLERQVSRGEYNPATTKVRAWQGHAEQGGGRGRAQNRAGRRARG